MLKTEIITFFNLQRQIFGICPCCGEFFRISDCKVYLKKKPTKDWKDVLESKFSKLANLEEKINEKEEKQREMARKKGRLEAKLIIKKAIRKVDKIFTPRKLNPDDAKVIFHPIDYIVFNGMKDTTPIKNIILLDQQSKSLGYQNLHRSIEKVVERGKYDWITFRVSEDGSIKEEH